MLRPSVDAFISVTRSRPLPPTAGTQPAPEGAIDLASSPAAAQPADGAASRAGATTICGSRHLAARLLERNLLRIGGVGTLVDRRLAPALEKLRSRRLYRALGYVRLGDYLTERVGMSLRRCQAILRLERILGSLPGCALALQSGQLSLSKAEAIASVVTESSWIEKARFLSVADLREAIRVEREGGVADCESASPAEDPLPRAGGADLLAGESVEQDEPGRLLSFMAPPSVVAIWHWTLDLVRRVAGQQEPAWRCAEYLAAEFLSGVPAPPQEDSCAAGESGLDQPRAAHRGEPAPRETARDEKRPDSGRRGADSSGMGAWVEACDAVREALASIGTGADLESIVSDRLEGGDDELDAWALDARLRRLVRLRQSLAWRQGRLLASLASLRLHREMGFASFDDWIGERLPMSARRARYLISLHRRLRGLPLLADAYRRGLVSWCQVRLLIRVAAPATQSRWIRYARRTTVRRLEDVVIGCEIELANAPAHVGASPLPPADPLPGRGDRAPDHAAARPAACASGRAAVPTAAGASLHTSAPGWPGSAADAEPLHTSAPGPDKDDSRTAWADPHAWRRIAFWAPIDVASLWDSALSACRSAAATPLDDWECFIRFVQALRDSWENPDDPQWKRRHRIFERDGWRCLVPGCTSRSGLNEHHIVFRSQRGGDEEDNLVTLCVGHHQQGLHAGRIRCVGRAPDFLWWDLGIRPGGEPLVRYFAETIVTRRPNLPRQPNIPLPASANGGAG